MDSLIFFMKKNEKNTKLHCLIEIKMQNNWRFYGKNMQETKKNNND